METLLVAKWPRKLKSKFKVEKEIVAAPPLGLLTYTFIQNTMLYKGSCVQLMTTIFHEYF